MKSCREFNPEVRNCIVEERMPGVTKAFALNTYKLFINLRIYKRIV
jgi:hypothetical protein